jgi:carbon starvation protein
MWKLIRPRGFLTALLLGTTLLVFYTAVVIDHPNLVAPEFHKDPSIPQTIPWLFITLTTGAVAGFHLLIANGITARQIRRESDARYVGYGGALALGLLALSAILIGGTGFPSEQDWTQRYASWDAFKDLHQAAVIYVDGFARFAAILGLDPATARTLAAVVVLGLLVATLEAGLRVQKQLLAGLAERYPSVMPGKEKLLIGLAVFLSAALTLHDGHGLGGLLLWPIFGATDLIFAVFGFVLLTLSLRQLERPVATVLLPLIFLLAAANWALTIQMIQWWSMNDWILFALGIILIIIELGVTLLVFNFLKSSPRPQLDSVP